MHSGGHGGDLVHGARAVGVPKGGRCPHRSRHGRTARRPPSRRPRSAGGTRKWATGSGGRAMWRGALGGASRVASRARVGATMGRARADQLRARIVADVRTCGARTVMAAGAVSLEEFARVCRQERWSETGSRDSSGKSCRHTEGALRFGTPREIGRGNLIVSIAVMKKALEIAILGRLCCCSPSRNTAVAAVAAAVRAVVRRVTHRNRAKQAAHTQSNVPRCWTRSSPRAS